MQNKSKSYSSLKKNIVENYNIQCTSKDTYDARPSSAGGGGIRSQHIECKQNNHDCRGGSTTDGTAGEKMTTQGTVLLLFGFDLQIL